MFDDAVSRGDKGVSPGVFVSYGARFADGHAADAARRIDRTVAVTQDSFQRLKTLTPRQQKAVGADDGGADWFRTGDIGVMDEQGFVRVVDRIKELVITGGFNVYSAEVERVVLGFPGVGEAAVIGIPDEKWGELVTALVVTAPGSTLTEDDVIAWAKTKLAGYKCPKKVEFRNELARTATGKLQKFKLREEYWGDLKRQVN